VHSGWTATDSVSGNVRCRYPNSYLFVCVPSGWTATDSYSGHTICEC